MAEIELKRRAVYVSDVHTALLKAGCDLDEALDILTSIPTADVAPVRHGRWIDMQEDDATEGMWRCSACGDDRYFYEGHPSEYEFKFCPNCGAYLGGADNGE